MSEWQERAPAVTASTTVPPVPAAAPPAPSTVPAEPVPSAAAAPAPSRAAMLRTRLLAGGAIVLVLGLSVLIALNPEWILRFGSWGYAGAFLISLIASASLILPLPGIALAIALGTALNPLLLGLVTGVGSAIGELMGYTLGASGRFLLTGDQQRHYERLERWTRKYGAFAIFFVAVLPIPFFDVAGIVAGAIRMPIASFLVATALGKTIKYTVLILVGAGWFVGLLEWLQATPLTP